MLQRRRTSTVIALLATIGCGPPRLGPGSDGDETGSSSDATTASETSTSTTDTETSDSETSTDSWTTADFVPREDMYFECDPFLQDCREGEKCVPYASSGGNWDANKCVPIMGDAEPGEPCTYGGFVEATDDCDATSICWDMMDVDGEWIGTCHGFCTGSLDSPECPMGASCLINANGSINICVFDCDPLLQDCSPEQGCYWASDHFVCAASQQELPTGEPCEFVNDCAPGHLCAEAEALPSCEGGSACCTPFCDIELGDQQCEAMPGTSCVPFFEEGQAPPGYERLGLCTLP